MQDVSGEVEGERLLQSAEAREVGLVAGLVEHLQGLVRLLHVGAVMLVVMELHDLGGDMGLQGGIVVVEVGQDVAGHDFAPFKRYVSIVATHPSGEGVTARNPGAPVPPPSDRPGAEGREWSWRW